MIAQLKKLVRNVYENTGIEVSVFSQEGKCLLGNADLRPARRRRRHPAGQVRRHDVVPHPRPRGIRLRQSRA